MALGSPWKVRKTSLTGLPVSDLASMLEPAAYLKAQGVEVKAEHLAELAVQEGKGGKGQMTQLQAIRWLGAHPAAAKKAGALDSLRAVAEGKKGADAYGFAREHAAAALARIEGKPLPAGRAAPAGSVRGELLSWFPAGAGVFGAVDVRAVGQDRAADPDALSALLAKLIREKDWKPVYHFVDAVGNLRLDRGSFAVQLDEKKPGAPRVWVRLGVTGDLKELGDFLKTSFPDRAEHKGPGGEPIVLLSKKGESPAFALVGKTDIVVATDEGGKEDNPDLFKDLLDAWSGKAKSVVTGPRADVLKKVPEDARGLFVADVPQSLRKELLRASRLPAIPRRVVLEVTGGKATDARLRATLKDEEEAAAVAKALAELKEKGLLALESPPPEVKIPKEVLEKIRKVLDGVKIEASGSAVTATARIPPEAFKAALNVLEWYFLAELGRPEPR